MKNGWSEELFRHDRTFQERSVAKHQTIGIVEHKEHEVLSTMVFATTCVTMTADLS